VLDAGAGHELRLGDGGAGQADSPLRDLVFRHVHALMNLDMGADIDSGRLGLIRHPLHILLEHGQIDQHARRRQNILSDIPKVPARDAGFKLRKRKRGFGIFRGPAGTRK
jgi:hypothetical protein